MKKLIALMLGLVMIFSLSTTAFADGEQTGTTTITAEVPEASYTIHIPADVALEYGNSSDQTIGDVYVSNVVGEPTIWLTTTYTDLSNGSSIIPVTYLRWIDGISFSLSSGDNISITSSVSEYRIDKYTITACVSDSDWAAAAPGTYTATMTFKFFIP